MYKSDLFIVFSSLSGPEKRALSNFLASPYFNQKQEVTDLWQYMVKNAKFGAPAFKKQKVFENLFLGEPYDDKVMRHTMSWLLKTIEQFLAYSDYMITPLNETLHLTRAYKRRKLDKLFQKSTNSAEKQLQKMNQGQSYFHFNYLIEFEKYELAESQTRNKENNLIEMTAALDKYLLISKLKQACVLRSHQFVIKAEYDFSLVELLLGYIETSPYKDEPGIAAYHNCYLALTDNNTVAFQEVKKSIQSKNFPLPIEDIKMLYFSCINFCIRNLNKGADHYRREVFELFQFGLKEDILIVDSELSTVTYDNIASAGLKLKEFEWLDSFMHKYKSKLPPRHRENSFNYNLARLNFTQRKYDQAMELLHKVDDRHILLNLNAKVMLLKLYYELDEYDVLTSLLSSFKVMLIRKKVLGYHKTHYTNIIKFTSRLLNLKPRDQKAHDKLKHDIENAEVLQEKEWLLKQLELVK